MGNEERERKQITEREEGRGGRRKEETAEDGRKTGDLSNNYNSGK